MKSLKNVFATLAFALAFGAAFATTTLESVYILTDDPEPCQPISCVVGLGDCSVEGIDGLYFNDPFCENEVNAKQP
ncbi:DUF6520 family protein [Sinomicrobium oceani]|uniref:DUF6520 family protein n=1 Tax=Sinomicrobium oceani TaxID=1150368 RepID=UPI00227C6659|nr:DUF6520 family protein [Sinomicrobium oceani]